MVVEYKCEKDFLNVPDFWVEVVWKRRSIKSKNILLAFSVRCSESLHNLETKVPNRSFMIDFDLALEILG